MPFDAQAILELENRTAYETWLLEEAYRIVDQPIPVVDVDQLIYPPNGAPPTQTIHAVGHLRLGDWRPGFLNAGAPLILVTAFKIIDMTVEWALEQGGSTSTYRFAQKVKALREGIAFPPLIKSRPWLQERLISLYTAIEPLRGTIIHNRHFTTADGGLCVANSRRGEAPVSIPIAATDLRTLSAFAVSLVRHLEEQWPVDEFRERWLRYRLDQLAHLHGEPLLGQRQPGFLNVRKYCLQEDIVEIDLARIRADVAAARPQQDPLFDIRVVVIQADGVRARACLVPWSRHRSAASLLRLTTADLDELECPVPDDVNVLEVARTMTLS